MPDAADYLLDRVGLRVRVEQYQVELASLRGTSHE